MITAPPASILLRSCFSQAIVCQAPLLLGHSTEVVSDSLVAVQKLIPGLRRVGRCVFDALDETVRRMTAHDEDTAMYAAARTR